MIPDSVRMAIISIAFSVNALALVEILSYEWNPNIFATFLVAMFGLVAAGASFFIRGDEFDEERKSNEADN